MYWPLVFEFEFDFLANRHHQRLHQFLVPARNVVCAVRETAIDLNEERLCAFFGWRNALDNTTQNVSLDRENTLLFCQFVALDCCPFFGGEFGCFVSHRSLKTVSEGNGGVEGGEFAGTLSYRV